MTKPETVTTKRGRIVQLRSITPEDDELLLMLFHRLSSETRHRRFLDPLPDVADARLRPQARRLAAIDPVREAAVLAIVIEEGVAQAVGVARFASQSDDPGRAEFAIVVRDDYQGEGLGTALMQRLVVIARQRKLVTLWGLTLADNHDLLRLIQHCGVPSHVTCHRGELTIELQLG